LKNDLLVLGDRRRFIVRVVAIIMQLLKDVETFFLAVDPRKIARRFGNPVYTAKCEKRTEARKSERKTPLNRSFFREICAKADPGTS